MRDAIQATREGGVAVMATLVKAEGSTYRRPGARMVFRENGQSVGLISGGCLEADLAERAQSVLGSGRAQTVVYDMRSPDDIVWGLGLGCNGEVRVLLERVEGSAAPAYFEFVDDQARRRVPAVLATVFDVEGDPGVELGDRLTFDAAGASTTGRSDAWCGRLEPDAQAVLEARRSRTARYETPRGRAEVLLEYLAPPIVLLVFGAGADARPLVYRAADLGWRVGVFDNRPAYARPDRFPRAHEVRSIDLTRLHEQLPSIDDRCPVIVMTHHFLHDLDLMTHLLPSAAPYVGLLGPRKRSENLLAELATRGIRPTAAQLARFHGPVGIDTGSETPEEIALSALAEIGAVLCGRSGGFLRDRAGPLHDP